MNKDELGAYFEYTLATEKPSKAYLATKYGLNTNSIADMLTEYSNRYKVKFINSKMFTTADYLHEHNELLLRIFDNEYYQNRKDYARDISGPDELKK
jgi:hypothetical protein